MNELLLKEIEIICLENIELSESDAIGIWCFLDNYKTNDIFELARVQLLKDMVLYENKN